MSGIENSGTGAAVGNIGRWGRLFMLSLFGLLEEEEEEEIDEEEGVKEKRLTRGTHDVSA